MKWALAVLSGVFWFIAMPPFDQFWLAWFAYVPLLWACRELTAKKAFLVGWAAGTVANLGLFYWIYKVVVDHTPAPFAGGLLVALLLALQQGLREAIWLGVAKKFESEAWPAVVVLPTLYTTIEFLYPIIFPVHLGDSQHAFLYTHQLMDLSGPTGLSWVIVAFNVAIFVTLEKKKYHHQLTVGVALFLLTISYGVFRANQVEQALQTAPRLKVGMVENNLGVGGMTLEQARQQIAMAAQLARTERPDLIVMPETAIKTPPPSHKVEGEEAFRPPGPRNYPWTLTQVSQEEVFSPQLGHQIPLLFGCIAIDPNTPGPVPGRPSLYNAAFMLDGQGRVLGKALKKELLVFGEYVPGAQYFPWIYEKFLTKASAFSAGKEPSVIDFRDNKIGVSICYEAILPDFSYELLQKEPNLLVNLTNDGWFGKTAELEIHLAIAKARAVESKLFMVRSTRTGISAFIDPLGRAFGETEIHQPETAVGEVAWMPGGTVFSKIGSSFAWLCALLSALWCLIGWRRIRRP